MQVVSTLSTYSLEAVADASRAPRWFQLYVFKDREITRALVERAAAAGYEALVLTVDVPVLGSREADVRNQFALPDGIYPENLVTDEERRVRSEGGSGLARYFADYIDPALTWPDVEWLRSITPLPVLVKGVLRADDARLAVEHGAAGVIVSNHGGRQLDGAPAAIEVLREVAEAVGERADVLMDGGVRRGTDIVKALALGARAVLVGRPVLWGLAVGGEAGVARVLTTLRDELARAMALCGCRSVEEVGADLLGD
jgi:4-hydroxymandelate oxidase